MIQHSLNRHIFNKFQNSDLNIILMFYRCEDADFQEILNLINNAAHAYKGVIPWDCWQEPYMSASELREEIDADVVFWGYKKNGSLLGVMGLQDKKEVTLIRHAYVHSAHQREGIGSALLTSLCEGIRMPVLVGTWADATWAVQFYQKHGFQLVPENLKQALLQKYWTVPEQQIINSVVLTNVPARNLHAFI